jgi:hypothetical protein
MVVARTPLTTDHLVNFGCGRRAGDSDPEL